MIQIKRTACPPSLITASTHGDGYRNKQVVRALWTMQQEKCCYCEQLIPSEGHSKAVEHFRPQAIFKSSRNDWRNLLLACPQCNGKKSDKFPIMLTNNVNVVKVVYLKKNNAGDPAIIDPSSASTNPEKHLDYHLQLSDGDLAGQIRARDKSLVGKTTIEVTAIDQAYIHKRRRLHFRILLRACIALGDAKDVGNADNLENAKLNFQNLMSDGHEFAGMAREFGRKMHLDDDYGLTIPGI
jgi:uncharacterized protein (TIGR02646 family)